jgi:hypothetical protein
METMVPLFISSSNQRIPEAPYVRLWLLCLLFVAIFMGGIEYVLRSQGQLKSISDDELRWSMELAEVDRTPADVLLVGASRLQLGFSPQVFERETGKSVQNLSISGGSALPVLRYIADETQYAGLVICSFYEYHLFYKDKISVSERYISFYRNDYGKAKTISGLFNRKIQLLLQKEGVFFSANNMISWREKSLSPFYVGVQPDRSRKAYYEELMSREDRVALKEKFLFNVAENLSNLQSSGDLESGWFSKVKELAELSSKIKSRGGRVLFVRYPISGEFRSAAEGRLPREKYWADVEAIPSATCMHYADYSESLNMVCPDGAHLNHLDAITMTKLIAKVVEETIFDEPSRN